jgi:RNA polymerase sigma factor (sigma-70 family)
MAAPPTNSIVELVRRSGTGDEAAAAQVFNQYLGKLTGLARSRLSRRLSRRVDADDVAASVFRSFFVGVRAGRLDVGNSQEFWGLLVTLTRRKIARQAEHHRAQRRSIEREVGRGEATDGAETADHDPTPLEAAVIADEVERLLARSNPTERLVIELTLQGQTAAEVASHVGISARTVRRTLANVRDQFIDDGAAPLPPRVTDGPLRRESLRSEADSSAWPPGVLTIRESDLLLKELIGQGGSGKVYRARWRGQPQDVAVKFLRKQFQIEPAAVSRFIREAQILAPLQHPGIVRLLGVGTSRGGRYVVLELVDGDDLETVRQRAPVSWTIACRWALAAAEAVEFAHQQGVLHCDLKPANLLLSSAGEIRVTDFGLAVSLKQIDSSAGWRGTAPFVAPELLTGDPSQLGPPVDVYGLSAVLYTLVAGRPPYCGNRVPDVLAQVMSPETPAPIKGLIRECPKGLSALCAVGLAKKPEHRFTNVGEFVANLQSVLRESDSPEAPSIAAATLSR